MTLEELRKEAQAAQDSGVQYYLNEYLTPAKVLKLLEMIRVLRQPLAEIRDRLQVTSVSHQIAVVGLARADNIERSL